MNVLREDPNLEDYLQSIPEVYLPVASSEGLLTLFIHHPLSVTKNIIGQIQSTPSDGTSTMLLWPLINLRILVLPAHQQNNFATKSSYCSGFLALTVMLENGLLHSRTA